MRVTTYYAAVSLALSLSLFLGDSSFLSLSIPVTQSAASLSVTTEQVRAFVLQTALVHVVLSHRPGATDRHVTNARTDAMGITVRTEVLAASTTPGSGGNEGVSGYCQQQRDRDHDSIERERERDSEREREREREREKERERERERERDRQTE
jgi:signal transduction histidine kinase